MDARIVFHRFPNQASTLHGRLHIKIAISKSAADEDKDTNLLKPTPVAQALFHELQTYFRLHATMRERVLQLAAKKRPTVRIGATNTTGWWVLSSVLSNISNMAVFDPIDVKTVIAPSSQLILQLNGGLLDLALAYAREEKPTFSKAYNIKFHSLRFDSAMILICHPEQELWVSEKNRRENKNAGYFKDVQKLREAAGDSRTKRRTSGKAKETNFLLKDLRTINLANVDFSNLKIIITESWEQPDRIMELVNSLDRDKVEIVPDYDDALAMVRTGTAVALVTEPFAKRQRVCPFRLEPPISRYIGIYYPRTGMTAEACRVATFIDEYFQNKEFAEWLHEGKALGYRDDTFMKACEEFQERYRNMDWQKVAKEKFPRD